MISTYLGQEKDAVLLVQMGSQPDGTNYEQQTVLNATAKQLMLKRQTRITRNLGGSKPNCIPEYASAQECASGQGVVRNE
jgi:hypothetical protein